MKIAVNELKKTLLAVALKYGASPKDAAILIEECIEGELEGKRTHGIAAFVSMIPKLKDQKGKSEIIKTSDSFVFIDAHSSFGSIVGRHAANIAIEKAKNSGVAIASIKNMTTWLRPASIARYIATHHMVGFVINSGGNPMVAPPGGYEPLIGTNPIGIGIPTTDEPIIADMATSTRAWGVVRNAIAGNTSLPSNSYLDNEGNYTTDPHKAYSARPMADHKGFALGLFIEVMCGAFVDMSMAYKNKDRDYRTMIRGGMIIVFDPAFIGDRKQFETAVTQLVATIHNSKPLPNNQVTLPGDRATQKRTQVQDRGYFEIDDHIWKQIKKL